jgi:hypothetical protein
MLLPILAATILLSALCGAAYLMGWGGVRNENSPKWPRWNRGE